MTEATRWIIVVNNPTEDCEQQLTDLLDSRYVKYGIFGREVGDSGTPHLQGFCILDRARRMSFLRNRVPRGHFEVARGTDQQASDYCKKDGDFEEFGTMPVSQQGRRTDLERIVDWIDEFTRDNGRAPGSPELAKYQPAAYIRYYHRLTALAAHRAPRRQLEFGDPLEWQQQQSDRLTDPADDRTVDFIIDPEGGKGKTWFCRWMLTNNDAVQVLGVGKKEDMAYILDETKTIFLFNVARGQMEFLSYSLLESLKDRMVMSGKYSSRMKTWTSKVHVVVLGNEMPDESKMTADRYNIEII